MVAPQRQLMEDVEIRPLILMEDVETQPLVEDVETRPLVDAGTRLLVDVGTQPLVDVAIQPLAGEATPQRAEEVTQLPRTDEGVAATQPLEIEEVTRPRDRSEVISTAQPILVKMGEPVRVGSAPVRTPSLGPGVNTNCGLSKLAQGIARILGTATSPLLQNAKQPLCFLDCHPQW